MFWPQTVSNLNLNINHTTSHFHSQFSLLHRSHFQSPPSLSHSSTSTLLRRPPISSTVTISTVHCYEPTFSPLISLVSANPNLHTNCLSLSRLFRRSLEIRTQDPPVSHSELPVAPIHLLLLSKGGAIGCASSWLFPSWGHGLRF